MHFCHIFGLSKLLTGGENGSQKGITEREFGSQISLPDGNLALRYHYKNWALNHTPLQKVEYLLNESWDPYEI